MTLAVLTRTHLTLLEKELVTHLVGPRVLPVRLLVELVAGLDRMAVGILAAVLIVPRMDENEGGEDGYHLGTIEPSIFLRHPEALEPNIGRFEVLRDPIKCFRAIR